MSALRIQLFSPPQIRRFIGHENGVSSSVFLPGGQRAISSAADGKLILGDLETGEVLREFSEHSEWIWKVVLSPDAVWAASAAMDGTVIVRLVGELELKALIAYACRIVTCPN
jgi:WD40 repeat protein